MTRRYSVSTLFALSTFGCVIDPGVLEGGNDELDDSGDTGEMDGGDQGETGDALLAECLQGTNPAGGSDPEDFPVAACELSCDEGWGHESPAIPIAWTLHFEVLDPLLPIGVVARSGGDGVVVVSRRDEKGIELATVSSDGVLLDITTIPTSLRLDRLDAADGVIHLATYDEDKHAGEVVAIDEAGALLWSSPQPGSIRTLAAVPGGGVIVGGSASLTHLAADGSTSWTAPSIGVNGIEVSPSGRILVGGYDLLDLDQAKLALYSELGEPIEAIDVPGWNASLWDLHFFAERRFYASGTQVDVVNPLTGNGSAMVIDLDDPELGWTREYNRALDSCEQGGVLVDEPTWEWFGETAMLADGTLLVAGAEAGPDDRLQPLIVHLDQQGEFLASDRGLWFGQADVVAAGDDGSGYAALTIGGQLTPSTGFHLRKYQP